MSNLFEFIDFGDNNPTSATPSGRPKKKSTTILPTRDVEDSNSDHTIESVLDYDHTETEQYIKSYFKDSEKIGKENIIFFENKKTMYGKKITALDKIKEVAIINSGHTSQFISISFKLITETEIKQVSKEYTTIGAERRYPLLVEVKYVYDPKYKDIYVQIQNEFL